MPMATSSSTAAASVTAATATSSSISTLSSGANSGSGSAPLINTNPAQFREIHKNTWLKRLTAEGKKITVGPKKSDRSWVVFCVHDDTDALLEGYAEPRQAAAHSPEWIVSMQDTLHISHALIPNSHEFEFVVTLANEVIRFHAMSWEIMQEWVETLRSKLREMKILSPRENLYTKLPEIRAPLLPTRDPTSPLPAPPPVPAAIVPGVERIVPPSSVQDIATNEALLERPNTTIAVTTSTVAQSLPTTTTISSNSGRVHLPTTTANVSNSGSNSSVSNVSTTTPQATALPALTAMSNTLTQNLLNLLSDPISAYSEQINDALHMEENNFIHDANDTYFDDEFLSPILRKSQQRHGTSTISSGNSVRVDIGQRASADQIKNWESLVQAESVVSSRLQTSRSLSAGAADTSRKEVTNSSITHNVSTTSSDDNITEFEISVDPQSDTWPNTSITSTNSESIEQLDVDKMNITIIQVSANDSNELKQQKETKTSAKVSNKRVTGEIFKFPDAVQTEYKSNVQIIPSTKSNSSTIQVLGTKTTTTTTNTTTKTTPYATPVKRPNHNISSATTTANLPAEELKITTVHVIGNNPVVTAKAPEAHNTIVSNAVSLYGTCYNSSASSSTAQPANASSNNGTPKMMKKIILSANTSGITNITVDNASTSNRPDRYVIAPEATIKHNAGSVHYEKVFLSTSNPPELDISSNATLIGTVTTTVPPLSPTLIGNSTTHARAEVASSSTGKPENEYVSKPSSPIPQREAHKQIKPTPAARTVSPTPHVEIPSLPPKSRHKAMQSPLMARAHPSNVSPMLERRRITTTTSLLTRTTTSSPPPTSHQAPPASIPTTTTTNTQFPLPGRGHLLTRGLTEAVITTRPSRRDFHLLKASAVKGKPKAVAGNKSGSAVTSNNNGDNVSVPQPSTSTGSSSNAPQHNRSRNSELMEQRRRSSSTSDARTGPTRGTNNNELPGARNTALRFQHPPQPFRNAENGLANDSGNGGVAGSHIGLSSPLPSPSGANSSPANKRMTLREHQVMQLRREIMHPGGVRLQLRRKDCLGSIAWVDAFGAVWVAGWKQKEHPVLYNALHIGDQLLSIAGTAITTANEANKIIRNTNTLFVEVLVRRIPFGRGYAIRREREGQCLGLIRDGNTATIVDVVPNSLAARHGLPPKAQSCDGTTLTFWVLTEINGRPLNLFFKENEIRDRLNSVGRDISILVQPSDLITKLKKQLKSLRGYKDYLVQ
ncbi:mucin-5AC [Bactrocera neohumeralis]|uniref:mucin-5AC n=1 Tax=Bactrocera tryoni TaxID=59916 RepID=UPI001A97848B|nr:mucin-5AC [Bactrocera tryoni]XP_050339491.1 mucin-5AC [Bactrocera neohumeralis]